MDTGRLEKNDRKALIQECKTKVAGVLDEYDDSIVISTLANLLVCVSIAVGVKKTAFIREMGLAFEHIKRSIKEIHQ